MRVKYIALPVDEVETRVTFWDMINNLYGYILLFDPFILDIFKTIPEHKDIFDTNSVDGVDLCIDILPRRKDWSIEYKAKRLILAQPEKEIYSKFNSLINLKLIGKSISLCEDLIIDKISTRTRSYPQDFVFQHVTGVKKEDIYASVGEWPALFIRDKVAVFTIEIASLFISCLNEDKYNWLEDVSILWVLIIYKLFGKGFTKETINLLRRNNDIRRDFHAFGFALFQMQEIARLESKNCDKAFKEASCEIINASHCLVNAKEYEATRMLKKAFEILRDIRERLAPVNISLIDALHGSLLYDDIAFGELDWPQAVANLFKKYIHLIKTRKYKMCWDLDMRTLESMSKRFPHLIDEVSRYCRDGKMEFINGSFTQHYPHFCSVETNIRELSHGKRVMENILKTPLVSYGGQEFSVNPAMPQILNKLGYKYAINRIQNFGYAPVVREKIIMWQGKDGSSIPAIPSHLVNSEKRATALYLNLAILLHRTVKEKLPHAIFTNFQDLSMIPFREETARANYFSNVFGSHMTVKDCFKDVNLSKLKKYAFTFNDYEQGIFYISPVHRGNEKDPLILANILERRLIEAELLSGITAFQKGGFAKDFQEHWRVIEFLSGHDAVFAANLPAGRFEREVINDYKGPASDTTTLQRAKQDFTEMLREVNSECYKSLKMLNGIGRQKNKKKGILIFNQLSVAINVAKEIKPQKYILVSIPPCGYTIVSKNNISKNNHVRVTNKKLENEEIVVGLDRKTGAIERLVLKKDNYEFIRGLANEFVYGFNSQMVCDNISVIKNNGVKGTVQLQGKIIEFNEVIGLYETNISLTSGSKIIDFFTKLKPVKRICGNPFTNSFRVRFPLAFSKPEIFRCYLNATEFIKNSEYQKVFAKVKPKPYIVHHVPEIPGVKSYSSLYYTRFAKDRYSLDHYNAGTQFYTLKGAVMENILIAENSGIDKFKYAVGINERNGFISSLKWQTQVISTEVSLPEDSSKNSWSFLTIDSSSVICSSYSYLGKGVFRLRLIETTGVKINTTIDFAYSIEWANEVDYIGENIRNLLVLGNSVTLDISGWGIIDIHVKLSKKL